MSERDDSVEPTEETEDPYAGVPQGKPGGIRLGGSAERVKVQCPTCHGKRTVTHQAFGQEVDAEGNRELIEVTEPCTVCYGTGEITELVLG